MGDSLSAEQQADVWEALSGAFNDNEVNYEFIARRIWWVPTRELKEIFFGEVAPECAFNVFAVIPPVWEGFDREGLAACIRAMQTRNRRSVLSRLRHRIAVALYHLYVRGYWEQIEAEVIKARARQAAGTVV